MEPGSTRLGLNYESSESRQIGRVWRCLETGRMERKERGRGDGAHLSGYAIH